MDLGSRTWRRLGAQLGIAIAIGGFLSCGADSPTEPTQSTPTPPVQRTCSVRLWGCATSGYGSIAWSSSTGASGIAYNYATREQADSAAIGYCAKSDCAVVAWFQNACGALATANTGQMATGTGTTGDSAQAFAVAGCLAK